MIELLLALAVGAVISRLLAAHGQQVVPSSPPVPGSPSSPSQPAAHSSVAPKPGNPATAQRIRALADLFDRVWSDVTGQPGAMPMPAKLLALAQAAAEGTGYGQGWDGDMAGSRNVGSYQCGGKQQDTAYYKCIPHVDSRPNADGTQTQYTTTFRYYVDGVTPDGKQRSAAEAGAWDFLRSITVKPFPALAELAAGDVLGYARKQYGQHYFEGFNLSQAGLAAYANSVAQVVKTNPPVRRAGETPEQVAGRIVFYAAAMARNIPQIAAALGLSTIPAQVSDELAQPWRPSYQKTANVA